MELIERMRMNQSNSISQDTHKYNCSRCKDTGFIEVMTDNRKSQPTMRVCECRKKEHNKKQWAKYGVNPERVKKIANYETHNDKTLSKAKTLASNYVYNIDKEKKWIAFLGQSGAGKSHLSIGVGAALLNKGYDVAYMPYAEVIQELKRNVMNEEGYKKILDRYLKAEILVIDDLFKDKIRNGVIVAGLNEADLRNIYPLLNYRYNNNLRCIISSEATPEMLRNLEEALFGRIFEKCEDNIIWFNGPNYNYRIRNIM